MVDGEQTFWQLWGDSLINLGSLFKITMEFVFTTCSSLWHKGTIISSPFHTLIYFPFTTIYLVSMLLYILPFCVYLPFSLFFLHTHTHTHTHTPLNSYNIKYHIHRVCFPKVHVIVHVMDIPKYFIFLHMWEDGYLILLWWFSPLPHVFLCV
jgi:hypothetical protein